MNRIFTHCAATGVLLVAPAAWAVCPPPNTVNQHDMGEVFIPRDAPPGSQIAQNAAGQAYTIECPRNRVGHHMLIGPRLASITAAAQSNTSISKGDHLYDSGVKGIGIAVQHTRGWICLSGQYILPNDAFFPFTGEICPQGGSTPQYPYYNKSTVYLVKTGPIDLGRHVINKTLYSIDYNGTQWATGTLKAAVTVSGCELPGAPFKQIDVRLGDHDKNVFTGKGSATQSVQFDIPLHGCLGQTQDTYAWNYFKGNYANIRLDPAQGAQVIDAAQGVLGLKSDSTASGVGVQVLQPDGTPMVLGQEVRLNRIENGTTRVPLKARYVQTTEQSPEPGSANSAANFTVTYQ